jgi:hypothetical protein
MNEKVLGFFHSVSVITKCEKIININSIAITRERLEIYMYNQVYPLPLIKLESGYLHLIN